MEIMAAHHQWAKRPNDQRFAGGSFGGPLDELCAYQDHKKNHSERKTFANRDLTVHPLENDHWDVGISGPNGGSARFTHWGFNQVCQRAQVPADYLRGNGKPLPAVLAADNLNWSLHNRRDAEGISVLLRQFGENDPFGFDKGLWAGAFNGENYGTVWDSDIAHALRSNFGDGATGLFKVPGEFGENVPITKNNTTVYGSDRDVWAFLVDEERRIDVPNRRDGKAGSMARGFYIANSEVGSTAIILGMFLFDYVCMNRIIWGAQDFSDIRRRHTKGAPHFFIEEVKPILREYAEGSAVGVQETIMNAKEKKLEGDVDKFLATRFGSKSIVPKLHLAFEADEGAGRPIETVFDAVTAATAYARQIPMQDLRVEIEREAGKLLALAA